MLTFNEMIIYLEKSGVVHFENQFLICRDFQSTIQLYKNKVESRIKTGANPKHDNICKSCKEIIEDFYLDVISAM
jgi:hypothetical protein